MSNIVHVDCDRVNPVVLTIKCIDELQSQFLQGRPSKV